MKTQVIIALLLAAGSTMAQQPQHQEKGKASTPAGEERRQPPTAADFIARLDKDDDALVSASEFDGPVEQFAKFDENGDGFISVDEAPKGPPQRGRRPRRDRQGAPNTATTNQPPQRIGGPHGGPPRDGQGFITRFDTNDDGKVSADEFVGPDDAFAHFDQDGDGYISDAEFPKGRRPGRRPGPPPAEDSTDPQP